MKEILILISQNIFSCLYIIEISISTRSGIGKPKISWLVSVETPIFTRDHIHNMEL